jgi:hypothetical protein
MFVEFPQSHLTEIQWSPLNGITGNGIIRLMESIFLRYPKPVWPSKAMCASVNGIIRLMESVFLGPKVIPLSGAHCIDEFDSIN